MTKTAQKRAKSPETSWNAYYFELGRESGRDEILKELWHALHIEERIAKAIALHEEQSHSGG